MTTARRLRMQGKSEDEIEETLSALAEQQRDDRRDRELEERLVARGYDLDALERDNPYNQWTHESTHAEKMQAFIESQDDTRCDEWWCTHRQLAREFIGLFAEFIKVSIKEKQK